jgi:hypothetical protein
MYREAILNTIPIELKEKTQKLEEEFVEEITIEMPDWVADRRVEFLESKIRKLELEVQWWDMLSRNYKGWFRQMMREALAEPMRKEQDILRREIDIYRKPKAINYDKAITEQDIQRARSVDLSNLIEIKKRVGKIQLAICPFHDDHDPSLHCYPDHYHCFVCGAHGDSIDLICKTMSLTFIEAVKYLGRY